MDIPCLAKLKGVVDHYRNEQTPTKKNCSAHTKLGKKRAIKNC